MSKAWEAETELAARLWRRYHSSPGVTGHQRGLAAVNRALHVATGKYPLLAEVYGRWAPEQVAHWGGWSGLSLVGPAGERAVVEGAPAVSAPPAASAASTLPGNSRTPAAHGATHLGTAALSTPDRAAFPLVHSEDLRSASPSNAAEGAPTRASAEVREPALPVVRITAPRAERRAAAVSPGSELDLAARAAVPLISSSGSPDQAAPPKALPVVRAHTHKLEPHVAEARSSGASERAASPMALPLTNGDVAAPTHVAALMASATSAADRFPSVPAHSPKRPRAVPVITPLGPAAYTTQAAIPSSEERGAALPPARPAIAPRPPFRDFVPEVLPLPAVGRIPGAGAATAHSESDSAARTPMVLSHAAASTPPDRGDTRAHQETAGEASSSAPPASTPGPVSEPDMDELKDELMRELQTRLTIERERRGWS